MLVGLAVIMADVVDLTGFSAAQKNAIKAALLQVFQDE